MIGYQIRVTYTTGMSKLFRFMTRDDVYEFLKNEGDHVLKWNYEESRS